MPFSRTIENRILDHLTAKATWTAPAATYVGLSSTTPTKDATNITEPSGGAYARQQITAAQWNTASAGATENNVDKSWSQATADWLAGAALTYFVLWAVSTGTAATDFLGYVPVTTPRAVLNGETAKILAGDLDLLFT